MTRNLRRAAVLGAGTMGARIAAHLANAGVDCLLFDLDQPTVTRLFEAMQKSRPAALFTPAHARRIQTRTFDQLADLAEVDWVIEAVVENFQIKRQLLAKVDRLRKPGTLVTSNTSGLPIASLAEGLSEDFRAHWCGTHFFNPPRQMRLLELIPTPATRPEVVEFLRDFCDRRLGKVVVTAKDRPNFIANRLFIFAFLHLVKTMQAQGLTIEEVDALTGPLIGRPHTATFRLADFVGVDVCVFVSENLHERVPEDERRDIFVPPPFLKRMLERKLIGDKAGQGFFQRGKKDRLVLDLETLEYRPPRPVNLPGLAAALRIRDTGARIRHLVWRQDRAGRFLWETFRDLFLYAAARIPEIADDIESIDTVMRWGFNWEIGLFEAWDAVGAPESVQRMKQEGRPIPPLVEDLLRSGRRRFYGEEPPAARPGVLCLSSTRSRNKLLLSNPSASLLDIGEGLLCLEFHSKANSVDAGVIAMLRAAIEETERHYQGLVIGNEGQNFCVGANLRFLLETARARQFDRIRSGLEAIQQVCLAIRQCRQPVVAAVFGQTLAGGCEIALHAPRVQALAETSMGLPEISVGLIPAAGGTKELLRRWMLAAPAEAEPLPYLKQAFEIIATAKISSCAAEAAGWRYLRPDDGVTMNRDRLIEGARQAALAMARLGYLPPPEPPLVPVLGRSGAASLKLGVYLMKTAGYITGHDATVAGKLAVVMAGGELSEPAFVPESYLLELEREAFLSLCGEPKTQERIQHLLDTGKPLRN